MKKSMKLTLTSILSVICALCMSFCVVGAVAKADEATLTHDTFHIIDGASIRLEKPTGIRFESAITNEEKTALLNAGAVFGTEISANGNTLNIETNSWINGGSTDVGYQGYYGVLVGGSENGGYTDFDSSHYTTVFSARGYVTYGGNTYYTDTVERTIAGVAHAYENKNGADEYTTEIINAAEKVTLSFNVNGGVGGITSKELVIGAILDSTELPKEPTKEGCTFGGWYYDEEFENPAFNNEILTENKTVYAKWKTTKTKIELTGSAISLIDNDNDDTYVQEGENWKFTKTSTSIITSGELKFNKNAAEGLFENGNYVIIRIKSNGADWLMHANNTNYSYDAYNDIFAMYPSGKTVQDTWVNAIYQIGSLNNLVGDVFYSNYAPDGVNRTSIVWEIGTITVCTAEEYAKMVESIVQENPSHEVAPPIEQTATKIKFDGSILKLVATGASYTKDGDNWVYKASGKNNKSGEFEIDTTKVGEFWTNGNWIIIELNSTTDCYICFSGQDWDGYSGSATLEKLNSGSRLVVGDGYAIHQIGAYQSPNTTLSTCDKFYFTTSGEHTFTIKSVTICTDAEFDNLISAN